MSLSWQKKYTVSISLFLAGTLSLVGAYAVSQDQQDMPSMSESGRVPAAEPVESASRPMAPAPSTSTGSAPGAESSGGGALYIKVGDPNIKKSLLALPPFQLQSSPAVAKNAVKIGKELYDTVSFDLTASGYFEFIKQDAYLEDTAKVGLRPAPGEPGGFKMDNWKKIGTDFLVRVGYRLIKDEITLETYLYHIPTAKVVLGKTYKANPTDIRYLAHKFSDDIVKALTGVQGFFRTRIAASRTTVPGQKEIFIMDWDGQNAQQVTFHKSISNAPTWSPDGKTLVYRSFAYHPKEKTRNADLFSYEIFTAKRWLLSYRPGINSGATFFPDGKNILLTISSGGNPDIYKMTLDGKSLEKITDGPRNSMNVEPNVSPNGKEIAFSSDRSGKPMIYVMNVDGSNVRRLTIAGDYNSTPRWSPDGKKLAFAGYDKGHFDLFVMDADGTNMKRLTSAQKQSKKMADNEEPSFSPDGRLILFSSNRTGLSQLYVVDTEGENERRITFDKHEYSKPIWSPYMDRD